MRTITVKVTEEQYGFINSNLKGDLTGFPFLIKEGRKGIIPPGLIESICKEHSLSFRDLKRKSREAELVLGRAKVYLKLRKMGYSLSTIGAAFGGRKHCTVLWSIKKFSA